ncbi:HAMP domain-containing sensor histidine kinase [Cellulomonas sp. NTE-D12]|uniref:sensor histidine kinase n=1 Tax=Cellulomonas sp. NTE-D12 TaxID=2962632 RepID=UPI0030813388|nr:two-component sensor histidine kinase [Cellulomonas sp. NTE-D12]
MSTRWTLRRRLLATVLGLLAVVATVMGVASTLALRASLVAQMDDRLRSASQRAVHAPERSTSGTSGTSGTPAAAPGTSPTPSATTPPTPSADTRPPWFEGPGQEVGTANIVVAAGVTRAGYIGTDGTYHHLDTTQQATLLALPRDGTVHPVDLGALGGYRAVAVRTETGATVVTALPTGELEATVERYVVVEVLVAVVGLTLAAVGANVLLRRELRPLIRVAATATRVSELPLDKGAVRIRDRVPARDTDPTTEVGQVGAALNRMLGHVEQALAARHESESQVRRFVADASHELRTPLASIRGYAELVRRSEEELPGDARQAMTRVEAETVRMTALVEDMLLLARLDAAQPLEHEPVDLSALAVDAVADAHASGPDHAWSLALPGVDDVPDDVPDCFVDRFDDDDLTDDDAVDELEPDPDDEPSTEVLGDDHRLRQVLANLLTNARVHTPAGTHVHVAVTREGADVVVRVTDDGPGIPPDLRERLFQRFTRGDASRNRAAGSSTGLGLAIAHAVVAAHGGELSVESEPGRTQFVVRLPAAAPAPTPAPTPAPAPAQSRAPQQRHREHLPTA